MRRKKMSVIVAVFAMLLGLAQVAGASIPNRFVSTDGDSGIVNINFTNFELSTDWYFGVYDFGVTDLSSGLDLLLGGASVLSARFTVTQKEPDGSWIITVVTRDGLNESKTLGLGSSDDFSFYFRNGLTYDTSFDITDLGDNNYLFDSTSGGKVTGSDFASVPLPNSAIFLFSGFVGLVAFGNRRKTRK